MLLLLLSVILVLTLIMSWISFMKVRKRFNITGPTPLPFLGNAHLFVVKSTEFLNLLQNFSNKYGDAYLVHLLSNNYAVLSHPKYIEPIVSSNELISKGRSYTFLRPWLGAGLLTSGGNRWRTHRKFLTPAFHFNILQNFLPVFCANGKILTEKLMNLADGRSIDMFPIIALAALDNVTESIMGVCVNAQKNSHSDYVKSIENLSKIISLRMQVPILSDDYIFNWLPLKKVMDTALGVLHGQTKRVIEARREDLKKNNIESLQGNNELGIKNKHAFLDLLLLAEIDGLRIDDESIKEEVDTFMFEGHDTTTSGIVFCLFCISNNPGVQDKILDELNTVFGDDMKRDPTYNELQQMKYLELVIKESLRLYPSVPLFERMMMRDIEIGPLKMVKNTSVLINVFQMHRHPDIYEDPLEFRPERFESAAIADRNPFSWLPFSAGPRNCIGQKFAMMEMKVTLSEIIRNFKLSPSNIEPQLCADLILRSANGVHVKLKPRY